MVAPEDELEVVGFDFCTGGVAGVGFRFVAGFDYEAVLFVRAYV